MAKVRVAGFSVSLDGYGAGPEQSIENPLGKRGMELHEWAFGTKTFRKMAGNAGGSDGVDEDYAARSMAGFGAFILGRNMFGPVRGAWPDESWKGWWGDNPPYHTPVFVLTHYARPLCRYRHKTHWSGARHRLNRDLSGGFGSSSYAREELIAEMTGAFVCAALSIVPTVRHASYLGSWLE